MNIKEGLGTVYQRTMFHWEHETAPEMADHVKSVVVGNNNIIQLYMDSDEIDEERLMEIREDRMLQGIYCEIMRRIKNKAINPYIVEEVVSSLPVDELCGWFEYFQEYHERRFDVKLISPEENAHCR